MLGAFILHRLKLMENREFCSRGGSVYEPNEISETKRLILYLPLTEVVLYDCYLPQMSPWDGILVSPAYH